MRIRKAEREFMDLQRVARVATIGPDGAPHNVPVCAILEGDRVYFATGKESQKVRNISRDPRVAIAFDDYTEVWDHLRGIMALGEARVLAGGPLYRRIRKRLYARYPQYEAYAAIEEGETVIVGVTLRHLFRWGFE